MYVVTHVKGLNKIPLRAYKSLDNAYEYLQQYIKESSFEWAWHSYGSSGYSEKLRRRYYRYSKTKQEREEIYIVYMKLYE